ncbi:MAG: cytochrome c oxidase assembly protein [Vitreoscilla sp.]
MRELSRRRSRLRTAACCAGLPATALAHLPAGVDTAQPSFPWSFEPWVLACLVVAAAMYAMGVARLWSHAGRGRGLSVARVACWWGGWVALVAALVSPLDPLGERLFSAHMLQHEMLMVVAAPLLVLGRPLAAWAWALPPPWRAGAGGLFKGRRWLAFWGALTHPLSAWCLHAIALWGWHLPALFEAALNHRWIHTLQHLSFLGSALLFWWTTIAASTRRARGAAMASLFTTMAHTGALGALMTLSPLLWYSHYAATTAAFGLDPLEDQQLGGLIMWIPSATAYLAAGLVVAARWLQPARTLRRA